MRAPASRWEQFWTAKHPGHSLAVFRIGFGIYLLCFFGSFAGIIPAAFSTEAVVTPFLLPDLSVPPPVAYALFGITLAVIVAFTVGLTTRIITPLLLLLYLYYYYLNFAVKNTSYDRLNITLLLLACFGDLDRVWSLTSRLRAPALARRPVYAWTARAIAVEITLFYLLAGIYKALRPAWQDGQLIYWTFLGMWATPPARWLANLGLPLVIFSILTWSVVLFEIVAPFTLWIPKTRLATCIAAGIFHLCNYVFLDIPEFLNCIATYPLFFPPESVSDFAQRRLGIAPYPKTTTAPDGLPRESDASQGPIATRPSESTD